MTYRTIQAWAYKHRGEIDLTSITKDRSDLWLPNTAAGQNVVAVEVTEVGKKHRAYGEQGDKA